MKLNQLRYLREVVDTGFSISRAAARMHTSPSGVSKQLAILESELGTLLLTRRSTRITGLTRAGEAVMPAVRRILRDADQVRRVADELTGQARGRLAIATTHTHARYALVPAVQRFVEEFPEVALHLRQGTPAQIVTWVASGEVDFGIGTAPAGLDPLLTQLPCYDLEHSVVVPRGHPLSRVRRLTMEKVAAYPFITNDPASRLGRLVEEAFTARGLAYNVVIRAIDTNVMKKYVELGFGIAVLPTIAVDPAEDTSLTVLPAGDLFRPAVVSVIMRKGEPLPEYARRFVEIARQQARGLSLRSGRQRPR
jgi:LysR family transcriptional regulator, cys regulon transcriptional activator